MEINRVRKVSKVKLMSKSTFDENEELMRVIRKKDQDMTTTALKTKKNKRVLQEEERDRVDDDQDDAGVMTQDSRTAKIRDGVAPSKKTAKIDRTSTLKDIKKEIKEFESITQNLTMEMRAARLKMEKDREAALEQKNNEIIMEKAKLFMAEFDEEIRDSKSIARSFYDPRLYHKAHEIIMDQEGLRPLLETAAKDLTMHPCMKRMRDRLLLRMVKVKVESLGGDPEEFQRQLDYDRSFR